jgi:ribose 5-phosphate isomerase A
VSADDLKRQAAARAVALVEPGMRVGMGTGSTARHFVDLLGERVRRGLDVVGVPTSEATRRQAAELGIRLATLDDLDELDLTVDGADELDPQLRLIKGGGGAHLREKLVALASRRMVVIADESKEVATLGRFPLPIEVVPFGLAAVRRNVEKAIAAVGCSGKLIQRMSGAEPFVTDCGNWILDAHLGAIPDPEKLATALDGVTGVVEHGLFIGIADVAILAAAGGIRIIGSLG